MTAQFLHLESYSRVSKKSKKSARSIAREADRVKGYITHIRQPRQPLLIFGESPVKIVEGAILASEQAIDTIGRKLRKDAQIIACAVVSHPMKCSEIKPKKKALNRWLNDTKKWAKDEWGENLKSIVLHVDESHPHVHIYAVPPLTDSKRMDIGVVHPGIAAKKAAQANKMKVGQQRFGYKKAMKEFQDRYYEAVGCKHGQARTGPKRQRYSPSEYKMRQEERERLAKGYEYIALEEEQYALKKKRIENENDRIARMEESIVQREERVAQREIATTQENDRIAKAGDLLRKMKQANAENERLKILVRKKSKVIGQLKLALKKRSRKMDGQDHQLRR